MSDVRYRIPCDTKASTPPLFHLPSRERTWALGDCHKANNPCGVGSWNNATSTPVIADAKLVRLSR